MKIFITRSFKWWEIGLIKICLLSLGIVLGLSLYNYLTGFLWLWLVLFISTAIYFIVRFFIKD